MLRFTLSRFPLKGLALFALTSLSALSYAQPVPHDAPFAHPMMPMTGLDLSCDQKIQLAKGLVKAAADKAMLPPFPANEQIRCLIESDQWQSTQVTDLIKDMTEKQQAASYMRVKTQQLLWQVLTDDQKETFETQLLKQQLSFGLDAKGPSRADTPMPAPQNAQKNNRDFSPMSGPQAGQGDNRAKPQGQPLTPMLAEAPKGKQNTHPQGAPGVNMRPPMNGLTPFGSLDLSKKQLVAILKIQQDMEAKQQALHALKRQYSEQELSAIKSADLDEKSWKKMLKSLDEQQVKLRTEEAKLHHDIWLTLTEKQRQQLHRPNIGPMGRPAPGQQPQGNMPGSDMGR